MSNFQDRFDIKKDKKGMVFVLGAEVKEISNAKELYHVFDEGSKNRHVASTSKYWIQVDKKSNSDRDLVDKLCMKYYISSLVSCGDL
jgi:hypothetical protein